MSLSIDDALVGEVSYRLAIELLNDSKLSWSNAKHLYRNIKNAILLCEPQQFGNRYTSLLEAIINNSTAVTNLCKLLERNPLTNFIERPIELGCLLTVMLAAAISLSEDGNPCNYSWDNIERFISDPDGLKAFTRIKKYHEINQ